MSTPYENPTAAVSVPAAAPRRWLKWYVIAWAAGVAFAIWGGRHPGSYFGPDHALPPRAIPIASALFVFTMLAVQLALHAAVLHAGASGRAVWRELLVAALAVPFVWFAGIGILHAPPPNGEWLLLTMAWLLGTWVRCGAYLAGRVLRRLRAPA
jgi:hypothetical protein